MLPFILFNSSFVFILSATHFRLGCNIVMFTGKFDLLRPSEILELSYQLKLKFSKSTLALNTAAMGELDSPPSSSNEEHAPLEDSISESNRSDDESEGIYGMYHLINTTVPTPAEEEYVNFNEYINTDDATAEESVEEINAPEDARDAGGSLHKIRGLPYSEHGNHLVELPQAEMVGAGSTAPASDGQVRGRVTKSPKKLPRKKMREFPLRKDPRIVKVNQQLVTDLATEDSGAPACDETGCKVAVFRRSHKFSVTLVFHELKERYMIVALSTRMREYKLPLFQDLEPLRILRTRKEYETHCPITDSQVEVVDDEEQAGVAIKRFDSRLTRAQIAIILGLQNYSVALTTYIERALLAMLQDMCGFPLGQKSWSQGAPKTTRWVMILKLTKFIRVFFPMMTTELVEIIVKRGCYAHTQKVLRNKRSRRKPSVDANKS